VVLRERGPTRDDGVLLSATFSLREILKTPKRSMKHNTLGAAMLLAASAITWPNATAATVTFETVSLSSAGYWNGSDGSGSLILGGATFNNNYNTQFDYWSGFVVSNRTDITSPGYLNQYSAFAGGGAFGSANYSVGYYSTYETATTHVTLGTLTDLAGKGAMITNTTYAALAMRDGSGAKKFGGVTGNDPDWFLLTIQGYTAGNASGTAVNFYLADFRFGDNSKDFIVQDWQYVDFSPLGSVDEIRFSMASSDNNQFGILTPSYFAMDDFPVIPEPSSLMIALAGSGLLLRRKR